MNCSICLESAKRDDEIAALQCGHCFHKFCIDKWVCISKYCPSCHDPSLSKPHLKLFIDFEDKSDQQGSMEKLQNELLERDKKIGEIEKDRKELKRQLNDRELDLEAEREMRRQLQEKLKLSISNGEGKFGQCSKK